MRWLALLLLIASSSSGRASASKSCPRRHATGVLGRWGPITSGAFVSSSGGMVRRCLGDSNCRLKSVEVDTISAGAPTDESTIDLPDREDENYVVDRGLRFSGVGRLYANTDPKLTVDIVLNRLSSATVAVIGLGGVGSWAAESLCRSGVGNLILIDLDDICISNINRQLHATSSAVGKMKIDEMKSRILDINPHCNVTLIHDFVSVDNAKSLLQSLQPELTACIDAIDGSQEKTALLLACVDLRIPIVTCGGAAGRMDPTQIVVDDLTKVQEDRLLFRCRKMMRQQHGFPKVGMPGSGKKSRVRNWRIPAVYSTEVQQKPTVSDVDDNTSSFRTCDGALGTACFVTGTYGFVAANRCTEMIALDKLIVPKKPFK